MNPLNDLEIYLVKATPDAVLAWLSQHLGQPVSATNKPSATEKAQTIEWRFARPQGEMAVLWTGNVEKNIASLWFKTNLTDWPDDLACAESAHRALNVEIRCNGQGWQENPTSTDEDSEQPWVKWINGQSKPFRW